MKPAIEPSFTALVGIDWSDRKHDFCLQAAGSAQREFGVLVHSPRRSRSGPRRYTAVSVGRLPSAWKSPKDRWCMPCSGTSSSCCFR